MSGPLDLIRRNQRFMMAAVVGLSMIAFLFISPVMMMTDDGGRPEDPVVVESRYGALHETDLSELLGERILVNRLLVSAFEQAAGRSFPFRNLIGPESEVAVVDKWLLVQAAERLQLVVSDDAIRAFLRGFVAGTSVTERDYAAIINRLGATQQEVFSALRRELLAHQAAQALGIDPTNSPIRSFFLMGNSGFVATPAERLDYYQRLKTKVSIEALPIDVAAFAERAPAPTEKELRALYDLHALSEPAPGSPTPGFRVPERTRLRYFRTDPTAQLDESAVTWPEIEQYYQMHREEFRVSTLAPSSLTPDLPPVQTPAVETPPSGEPPSSDPTTEPEVPAEGQPAVVPPDEAAASPASSDPVDPAAASESPPSEETPAAPADDAAESSVEAAPDEAPPDEASSNEAAGQMVVYDTLQEDDTAPAQPAAAEAAATTAAEDAVAAQPATPSGAFRPLTDRFNLPGAIDDPAAAYRPVWEVDGEIRLRIARERAGEQAELGLQELRTLIGDYFREQDTYEFERDENPSLQPPPALDFQQLADSRRLEYVETPRLTQFEVSIAPTLDGALIEGRPLAEYMYREVRDNLPVIGQLSDSSRVLIWKSDTEVAQTPEFVDARETVERVWRMQQAVELARKEAEALADQARGAVGQSLTTVFPDRAAAVIQASDFSWLTSSLAGTFTSGAPQLTEVTGIQEAGPEFMRAVYDLSVDGVGVGVNNPHTVVYVIRLADKTPSDEVTRSAFWSLASTTVPPVVSAEMQEYGRQALERVREEAGLRWQRTPQAESRGSMF